VEPEDGDEAEEGEESVNEEEARRKAASKKYIRLDDLAEASGWMGDLQKQLEEVSLVVAILTA
jgi:hypothetical protein